MRIIDRYVTRQFVATLGAALIAFVVIYVLIDLIENLDTFIDNNTPLVLVVKYYLLYVPFMANLTLPVAVLLSCLFTIGQMVRHNESVALKASGVSLYRVLLPLFRIGIAISLFALLFSELVVPEANRRRAHVERVQIKKRPSQDILRRRDIYLQDTPRRLIYINEYASRTRTAKKVLIQVYDGDKLVERIDAGTMIWENSVWVLKQGERRTFEDDEEQFETFSLLRRSDFDFTPDDIAQRPKDPEEMNVLELRKYIGRVQRMGGDAQRWRADFHLKLSFPFTNMIIVLFGTALASVRRKSGAAVGFGISLFICFVYYTVMEAGRAFGRTGDLPPLAAAWIGNVIFGLIGVTLLVKARK
ncbi:MAG: LPS export ABC transporter permease LptG [Gemmatimonadota bacterium]|nr:MAG: LPS export ABC transporter permease LptG [Gemmatimonadota bacterium]